LFGARTKTWRESGFFRQSRRGYYLRSSCYSFCVNLIFNLHLVEMGLKLRLAMVGGFGILWYFGWVAPLKWLCVIARWLWQWISALKYQDSGPADSSMIAALRNATGSDFNQVSDLRPCLRLKHCTVMFSWYLSIAFASQ
jgi:hypothetical protein